MAENDARTVCLHPGQYDCWDAGNQSNIYDSKDVYRAELFKEDHARDIAILKCEANLLTRESGMILNGKRVVEKRTLPDFQTAAPREGESVSVSGFPAVMGFESGIPGLTTNTGTVANPYFLEENEQAVYLIDMRVNHGDSGGLVYRNADGKVIGFVDAYRNATTGENSGLTVVVPINQVLALL